MTLSVTDGFKFGCGIILAVAFAAAMLVLLVSVTVFVSTIFGVRFPLPMV